MRSYGLVSVAVSGAVVTSYHILQQPPPELGIAPEMFDWSPRWAGQVFDFVLSTLMLALVIALAAHALRWLIGLSDRGTALRHKRPRQGGA